MIGDDVEAHPGARYRGTSTTHGTSCSSPGTRLAPWSPAFDKLNAEGQFQRVVIGHPPAQLSADRRLNGEFCFRLRVELWRAPRRARMPVAVTRVPASNRHRTPPTNMNWPDAFSTDRVWDRPSRSENPRRNICGPRPANPHQLSLIRRACAMSGRKPTGHTPRGVIQGLSRSVGTARLNVALQSNRRPSAGYRHLVIRSFNSPLLTRRFRRTRPPVEAHTGAEVTEFEQLTTGVLHRLWRRSEETPVMSATRESLAS